MYLVIKVLSVFRTWHLSSTILDFASALYVLFISFAKSAPVSFNACEVLPAIIRIVRSTIFSFQILYPHRDFSFSLLDLVFSRALPPPTLVFSFLLLTIFLCLACSLASLLLTFRTRCRKCQRRSHGYRINYFYRCVDYSKITYCYKDAYVSLHLRRA